MGDHSPTTHTDKRGADKVKSYHQTFEGEGIPPLDMLRYDACWPTTQDDVVMLGRLIRQEAPNRRVSHPITFTSHQRFTLSRWQSFGWRAVGPTV